MLGNIAALRQGTSAFRIDLANPLTIPAGGLAGAGNQSVSGSASGGGGGSSSGGSTGGSSTGGSTSGGSSTGGTGARGGRDFTQAL